MAKHGNTHINAITELLVYTAKIHFVNYDHESSMVTVYLLRATDVSDSYI